MAFRPSKQRSKRDLTETLLKPIRTNAGLVAGYRKRLDAKIERMRDDIGRAIRATWRRDTPVMTEENLAADALPSAALQKRIDELRRKWLADFDTLSGKLAEHYAKAVQDRSDASLKAMLRDAGFTVEFRMTRAMRDVFRSTVEANVSLIKSIPAKYLDDVQGSVMRAVQTGRDLGSLTQELQQHYGVTRRRAAFISLDQMNKATSALMAARQQEVGIREGKWKHSHAGKTPRPSHVKMDGQKFDLAKGIYDPEVAKWIMPGELPHCRCYWTPILPGFG